MNLLSTARSHVLLAFAVGFSIAAPITARAVAPATGQIAAIYRGTATYTVTSYTTGVAVSMPARFKFVDTFYFIQYSTNSEYTNSTGSTTAGVRPLLDSTVPNNTAVPGDPGPTMNHYSLIYFTTGKHPFSAKISGSADGDFDLGYDCPFVGVNRPGSGPDLMDLYHLSVGPNSFLTQIPAGKVAQPGGTFIMLPILNDGSTNDVGSGDTTGTPDGINDNVRTQMLALVGSVAAKSKVLAGTAPLANYGGGFLASAAGGAYAADKLTGLYSALSIFNGGEKNVILQNPYRDPFKTGAFVGNESDDVVGATVTTIAGKWDLKLDKKLTAFANNNTRPIDAGGTLGVLATYTGSGRTGAVTAVANNKTANGGGSFTGDGSQFAAELVVFEALLSGTKAKTFQGAFPYTVNGFHGNFPNRLATTLF